MSQTIGLLVFGGIVIFFVILFWFTYSRVETGAKFASERSWEFQDLLPQLGRAQRQHIFRSTSPDGIAWELVMNLQQTTTQTMPTPSTIWTTTQISSSSLILIGPALDASFDQFNLANPVIQMFFRMILGDDADQIAHLQRIPFEGERKLTVLASKQEEARRMITPDVLTYYHEWLQIYKGEDLFPVLLLNQQQLRFKVKNALTRAADADTFVTFCMNVARCLKSSSKTGEYTHKTNM